MKENKINRVKVYENGQAHEIIGPANIVNPWDWLFDHIQDFVYDKMELYHDNELKRTL